MHFPSKYIGIEMYYVGHLPDTDIRSNAKTLRDIFHQNRSNLLLFLLTKHQNIFVINLQNRYIYDLLDCISLIALFKIIRTRGCPIIIWTGLNIKLGIVQKVYECSNCPLAKMIPRLENHFGKTPASSLV